MMTRGEYWGLALAVGLLTWIVLVALSRLLFAVLS